MINVIKTNLGNFGKLKYLVIEMRNLSVDSVCILSVELVDFHSVAMVNGKYTFSELEKIVKSEEVKNEN